MPAIVKTRLNIATMITNSSNGVHSLITQTTLTASDTLDYGSGLGQILLLRNPTGGTLNIVIDGDGASGVDFYIEGVGRKNVSAGLTVPLAAGQWRMLPLDTLFGYLRGTITVTGGTSAVAALIEPASSGRTL